MDTEDNAPSSPAHDSKSKAESSTKPAAPEPDEHASQSKSKGRFRFKSKSKSSSRSSRHDSHRHDTHRHRHRHRHDDDGGGHHHRRYKRRRTTTARSPSPNTVPSYPGPPLSPNTAFRESLFDALGDDEGAAFWESVYGQSVHSFAAPPGHLGGERDGKGELEQMDEEEYAAYVRGEMWKRTREGMLEEQERIRAEKRAKVQAEKAAGANEEKRKFERAMEDSLRRGRERRKMKEVWKGVWGSYLRSWEEIESVRNKSEGEGTTEVVQVRNLLFWPVETGKRRDVTKENVEEFMRRAPPQPSDSGGESTPDAALLSTLKAERVRWHPDKIQHRYGALGIDESVMRSVTEVFQIIDHLWSDLKR
ncbi:hypothetical protein ASPSYDRAFT_151169 [Aspergillus sydowii CBS 593.65]|uniref:J domain-containing protein n=1 Tax=Aspergillus sydowii CBS 593.65 TaxID=1036612 RepID=A0A1L9THQ7_9EURO|nr:uncharacterized protein ASPSYDRAFT_151169 [Aspergillus sydowii CBS 593.65]OJJ58932.1 hypothetical protein ASPSYDRAFT_151169 [Aspergillus sydowii CBS 593.65]